MPNAKPQKWRIYKLSKIAKTASFDNLLPEHQAIGTLGVTAEDRSITNIKYGKEKL